MLTKSYLSLFFFIFTLNLSGSCLGENNKLSNFSKETFYSADFSQSFESKERETIFGKIILKKPFFLKVSNFNPTIIESEILINKNSVYRIDYDLDQAVKYKKEKIINQIPAAFLLEDEKSICLNFSKFDCDINSCKIEPKDKTYTSNIEIFFDEIFLKKVEYHDAFGKKSTISISNFVANPKLSSSVFSYNYEVKDLISLD